METAVGMVAVGPVIVNTVLPFTVVTIADTFVVPVRALICPAKSDTLSPAAGIVMGFASMVRFVVEATVPLAPKL
jgi:hypothetical protein